MDIETIKAFVENNQFLAGGIGTVAFGAALASCRRVPYLLWSWFRRQFVVTVEITQGIPATPSILGEVNYNQPNNT